MKTAYELAMERLNKTAPLPKLTAQQKKALADLDSQYAAKIAEREIALKGELDQAAANGDLEAYSKLEGRLAQERQKLQAELERKKERVRQGNE